MTPKEVSNEKEGTIEQLYTLQNVFQYNKDVYCAFLDLEKAYDSVWRQAMFKKLDKLHKIPGDTLIWIKSMYANTKSCTRVGNKLSSIYQTHNGLQQGALSSPILFNLYINDLITELNQVQAGIHINNLAINNLLFADDIMLIASNKQQLQQLLDICSKWANKWKLKFSASKSKTLTNNTSRIPAMKLQGKNIYETDTRDYNYKYLGLPITSRGINTKVYFKKIRQKFYITLNEVIAYAEKTQMNTYNKLILYKTVIRSHIDYGVPVIHYKEDEINKLEQDQIRAIKRLLKLNYYATNETILAITEIPTIHHRLAALKTKFWLKLRQKEEDTWEQYKTRSIATKVFDQIRTGYTMRQRHTDRLPPNTDMYNTLIKYDLQGYIKFDSTLNYKTLDKRIKSTFYRQTKLQYSRNR